LLREDQSVRGYDQDIDRHGGSRKSPLERRWLVDLQAALDG
jgi:hypothetical protein